MAFVRRWKSSGQGLVAHTTNLSTKKSQERDEEFKAGLGYKASSRLPRTVYTGIPVSMFPPTKQARDTESIEKLNQ